MNPSLSASASTSVTYSFSGSRDAGCPAFDRHTTYRRDARRGLRLRDEALDLVFSATDPMRLVPVDLRCADTAILKSECSNPLAFPPSSGPVGLPQALPDAESPAHGDGVDVADRSDDLEH